VEAAVTQAAKTVVYFDGSCPLCRAEIDMYRQQDRIGALDTIDVSAPGAVLPPGLDRCTAMGRFHALASDGRLLAGAAAFAEVWRHIPGWRGAGRLAARPGFRWAFDLGYRIFLALRPLFVTAFLLARRIADPIRRPGH